MGEDIHFLERLERLNRPETQLALGLYRDPKLVQFVLLKERLPERAQRVAIALSDGDDGPWLVVARDGHFVTCLGASMRPGDLPIISRRRLALLMEQGNEMRDSMARAWEQVEARGSLERMLRSLRRDGPRVTREDWTALRALAPLMQRELLRDLAGVSEQLIDLRTSLLPRLPRLRRRMTDELVDILYGVWKTIWGAGHLAALVGEANAGLGEVLAFLYGTHGSTPLWVFSRYGHGPSWLRACWMIGRAGKPLLPALKSAWDRASTPHILYATGFSLLAMGLRHAGLAAEVRKALERTPRSCPAWLRSFGQGLGQAAGVSITGGADLAAMTVATARAMLESPFGAKLQLGPHAADLSDEDAVAVLCTLDMSPYLGAMARIAVEELGWTMRGGIDRLYLPEHIARHVRIDPRVAAGNVVGLLTASAELDGPAPGTIRREEPKVGRNALCPCGSGQKHKRCCGA